MKPIQEIYKNEVIPALIAEFGGNIASVPKMVKIVINCGMGEALSDKKALENMSKQLAVITGQKPAVTKAKKAISTYKLRKGDTIGLKVTIRGRRMYDFLSRLVRVALPRVRDFRGIPVSGFDGKGNYTMGISEQTIFPEVEFSMVDKVRGFEITFVTSANSDLEGKRLLELLNVPFEKVSDGK